MISEVKRRKILKLHKEGKSIAAIAKQVGSRWETVKKIVGEQKPKLKENPNYYKEMLGTAPRDLLEAQDKRNKRRSEVLARMNSDPGLEEEEARRLIDKMISLLSGTGNENT